MEENKNINPETQSEETNVKEKKKIKFKLPKIRKNKLLKNQALFKRGGYSIAITAAVLAGVIIVNVLLTALSNRFVLEFDMSSDKINSISEENVEYIKNLDSEVNVIMCAKADEYTGSYMSYYAQQYGITEDYTEYYKQTISLMDKYNNYNNKIKITYMDTQDSSFSEITAKYTNETLNYGDIIVTANTNGNERYKIVGFKDIYSITEDDTYADYGYTTSTISGNNIETALTSAIAYVTSNEVKKVALLTGHSKEDYTETYKALLKTNNYEIDVITDVLVNKISDEYDAVFIVAPTVDFKSSELDALSEFLDNGSMLDKGLVLFADATAPYLENLYSFLEQWGISIGEGILFETNSSYHGPDEPTLMISAPASDDEILNGMQYAITGYNVPVSAIEVEAGYEVTTLFGTSDTVVNAPVGTSNDWKGADGYDKSSYATVIKSTKSSYDNDNNQIESNVIVFSSFEFIYSEYSEYSGVSNKNMSLAAADCAVRAENTGISFISKTITNESFSDSVTQTASNLITIIFMILLPVVAIVTGIYVYIRRKNS